jgi:hypothetical protein
MLRFVIAFGASGYSGGATDFDNPALFFLKQARYAH